MENKDFKMCEMCSLLLTLLDKIEMITNDPDVLEITKQRLNAELELAIATIAKNHKRTPVAIASRISKKHLIQNFC